MRSSVFVSSTFQDLKAHRKAVWDVLARFDVMVRGMEQFGARKESPLETCLIELDQSDIYIALIAFRHGSIEPSSGKSYTQLEYERAVDQKKEVLVYLVDEENALFPVKFIDAGGAREKLEAFKRTLRDRHTVDMFVDERDLAVKLKRDLERILSPRTGLTEDPDESTAAVATLRQFFLLPKTVAGQEVRVRLQVKGQPYAASREVCKAFNFEFGGTVGLPVSIEVPAAVPQKDACDLFIGHKQLGDLLTATKGDLIEAYVRLHFSDTDLDNLRARFRTVTDYMSNMFAQTAVARAFGEPTVYKADSALALELARLLELKRTPSAA